jgi:hypothetical protein
MDIKKIIESKKGKYIIVGLILFVFTFIVFRIGIELGYREAYFSSRLGDNYSRNFLGESGGMMGFMQDNLPGEHGAVGKVVKIDTQTMLVATGNNLEKVIRFTDDTLFRKFRTTIKQGDINVDDSVVVIGFPNDAGEIVAGLIRVVPAATTTPLTTATSTNIK